MAAERRDQGADLARRDHHAEVCRGVMINWTAIANGAAKWVWNNKKLLLEKWDALRQRRSFTVLLALPVILIGLILFFIGAVGTIPTILISSGGELSYWQKFAWIGVGFVLLVVCFFLTSRDILSLINPDQLRRLERTTEDGGQLRGGGLENYPCVFVKSSDPIESQQPDFAQHVMKNIFHGVQYCYFFKDDAFSNTLRTIVAQTITNIVVEAERNAKENAKKTGALSRENQNAFLNASVSAIKKGLTIHMADESESFDIDYCVMNAQNNTDDHWYLRYRGHSKGRWAWVEWYQNGEAKIFNKYRHFMNRDEYVVMCATGGRKIELAEEIKLKLQKEMSEETWKDVLEYLNLDGMIRVTGVEV